MVDGLLATVSIKGRVAVKDILFFGRFGGRKEAGERYSLVDERRV